MTDLFYSIFSTTLFLGKIRTLQQFVQMRINWEMILTAGGTVNHSTGCLEVLIVQY